jgi:hypothetical protein
VSEGDAVSPSETSAWSPSERKLLEEVVVPSPHSVELPRTAMGDFLHRLARPTPHVAELFHENSKLVAAATLTVPGDGAKLAEARAWYFATAYAVHEDEVEPREAHQFRSTLEEAPERMRPLLAPFMAPGPAADLLYAVDLLALWDGRLHRLVATTPRLWVERSFGEEELARLRAAAVGVPAARLERLRHFLVLVACPWRQMMLYGPRGYRHTLLDAGRVLAQLERAAAEHGVPLTVVRDFYDARVDRLLLADGVERSAVVLVGLGGGGAG